MPATLPTAFCNPIQRPVARGPAKVWVTEGFEGLLRPSKTPVSMRIAAAAAGPEITLAATRQRPTPGLLAASADFYARLRPAPGETQRSSSQPAARTLAPSTT